MSPGPMLRNMSLRRVGGSRISPSLRGSGGSENLLGVILAIESLDVGYPI